MSMSWIAAIMVASAAGAALPPHPLQLRIQQTGETLEMSLVGQSASPWAGRYELEVTGGPNGASNHSVQRGTASIGAGTTVKVATLRLGNPKGAQWAARLHVTPNAGAAYDLEWRSAH
jgi:hypothetical protein